MGQSQSGTAAATAEAPSGAAAAVSGGCPVMQRNRSGKAGAELDPKNQMPAQPNQQPAPGQTRELPTERVPSTIPQADGQTKWVYPSPQMFYNALHRKGKATGEEEAHMEAVVAIHNNMNERTWRQILEWEQKYHSDCAHPSLARFVGRPDDLSVEARVRYWRTGDRPFDRHDWFVNRCGREVRYIIDYYDRPEQHAHDQLPSLHDETSVKSIELNVRPALDSLEAAADRAQHAAANASLAQLLPSSGSATGDSAPSPSAQSSSPVLAELREGCAVQLAAVAKCDSDEACVKAHTALMLCMASASKVCKPQADAFTKLADATPPADAQGLERAFGDMQTCMSKFAAAARAQQQTR